MLRSHGFRLDHFERKRKKEARKPHELAEYERKAFGLKAKLHHKKRHQEKVRGTRICVHACLVWHACLRCAFCWARRRAPYSCARPAGVSRRGPADAAED